LHFVNGNKYHRSCRVRAATPATSGNGWRISFLIPLPGFVQRKLPVCTFDPTKHFRADSISASVAPWFRAHVSAATSEYLAT
jgi:hypothetical protein